MATKTKFYNVPGVRVFILLFLIAIILVCLVRTGFIPSQFAYQPTMQLSNEGFETKPNVLVLFYRPGCPHCENMKPEWEVVKQDFEKSNVRVMDVDISKDTDVPKDISGVPTIRFYDAKGKEHEYQGERTAKAIGLFVKDLSA